MVLAVSVLAVVIGAVAVALYMMKRDGVGPVSRGQSQQSQSQQPQPTSDDNADPRGAAEGRPGEKGIAAQALSHCLGFIRANGPYTVQ